MWAWKEQGCKELCRAGPEPNSASPGHVLELFPLPRQISLLSLFSQSGILHLHIWVYHKRKGLLHSENSTCWERWRRHPPSKPWERAMSAPDSCRGPTKCVMVMLLCCLETYLFVFVLLRVHSWICSWKLLLTVLRRLYVVSDIKPWQAPYLYIITLIPSQEVLARHIKGDIS